MPGHAEGRKLCTQVFMLPAVTRVKPTGPELFFLLIQVTGVT